MCSCRYWHANLYSAVPVCRLVGWTVGLSVTFMVVLLDEYFCITEHFCITGAVIPFYHASPLSYTVHVPFDLSLDHEPWLQRGSSPCLVDMDDAISILRRICVTPLISPDQPHAWLISIPIAVASLAQKCCQYFISVRSFYKTLFLVAIT